MFQKSLLKNFVKSFEFPDFREIYKFVKSYKKYFSFSDKENEKLKIPRYNGNLFKADKLLDNLIIDDKNSLISVYILRSEEFKRFLKRAEVVKRATFWCHLDILNELYNFFIKNSITQKDFINLVDIILNNKEKIEILEEIKTIEEVEK